MVFNIYLNLLVWLESLHNRSDLKPTHLEMGNKEFVVQLLIQVISDESRSVAYFANLHGLEIDMVVDDGQVRFYSLAAVVNFDLIRSNIPGDDLARNYAFITVRLFVIFKRLALVGDIFFNSALG